jgi:uncharacterized protein YdbL (DUF1318 family)
MDKNHDVETHDHRENEQKLFQSIHAARWEAYKQIASAQGVTRPMIGKFRTILLFFR